MSRLKIIDQGQGHFLEGSRSLGNVMGVVRFHLRRHYFKKFLMQLFTQTTRYAPLIG